MSAHKFAWIRVGDGDLEPAAIKRVDGVRTAFTIACPDGFPLGKGSAVKVGDTIEPPYEMLTDAEQAREDALARKRQAYYRKMNPLHGYAGFGRKALS